MLWICVEKAMLIRDTCMNLENFYVTSCFSHGRDTCMDLENFYVTPSFSHDYQLTLVEYIKQQNTQSVCTTREKDTKCLL